MLMSDEFSRESPPCEEKGKGAFTWNCPEYIQSYSGLVVKGAMHGCGEYRWRHLPQKIPKITFEGQFYVDRMEGNGVLSYADGTLFRGLFHRSYRYGPGVETRPDHRSNVGLWSGDRLVRLSWSPRGVVDVPELLTPGTAAAVLPHRVKLKRKTIKVNEINCAAKVLKDAGATEEQIKAHCGELYSNCTHTASAFFEKALFDEKTFGSAYDILEVIEEQNQDLGKLMEEKESLINSWNNSCDLVQMMRHTFKHRDHRSAEVDLNIVDILSGSRGSFGPPDAHELDCRAILLASYRGETKHVARLINEHNVCPDISDSVGNTALMYACCADQSEVVSFLMNAGVSINRMNDSCITPLGMCLMRYVALKNDVPMELYSAHFLPRLVTPREIDKLNEEWNIIRNIPTIEKDKNVKGPVDANGKTANYIARSPSTNENGDEESEKRHVYWDLIHDIKIDNRMANNNMQPIANVEYVFMVEKPEEPIKSLKDKDKPRKSDAKISKSEAKKTSISRISDDNQSILSTAKIKSERLERIESTIIQLLELGADPRLVKFPQSAMAIALFLDNSNLIMKLVESGANVEEEFKEMDNYKAIDIAMFRPLNAATLNLIVSLLKCGATVDHRIPTADDSTVDTYDEGGPTLLHVLVGKLPADEAEMTVQINILELLLKNGADASLMHEGQTALDNALETQKHLVETFARHRAVNLDDYVNQDETPLIKLFTVPFFSTLQPEYAITILQTFLNEGANPLLETEPNITPEESLPTNLFTYASQQLATLVDKQSAALQSKKQSVKSKDTKSTKTAEVPEGEDLITVFREAIRIAKQHARRQCVRWMSVELLRDLLDVVYRFQQRAWHMIVREHERTKETSIWLDPVNCLDAWNILKFGTKHKFLTKRVFYKAICIMLYYHRNPFMTRLTIKECESIENDAKVLMTREDKTELSQKYMKNLIRSKSEIYKVCFECLQPLTRRTVECERCRMISFCSQRCFDRNTRRCAGHPCAIFIHVEEAGEEESEQDL